MANTVTELYFKMKQLTAGGFIVNANSEIKYAIQKASDWAIELNKDQLESGLDSFGNKISPGYKNFDYANEKNKRNKRPGFGVPDLKNTGGFYSGFYAKYDKNNISINSSDEKTPALIKKYGKEIFGLTKESRNVFSDVVREEIIKVIEQKTGLKAS